MRQSVIYITYALLRVKGQRWPKIRIKFCAHVCNIGEPSGFTESRDALKYFVICVVLHTCENVEYADHLYVYTNNLILLEYYIKVGCEFWIGF
jgi:hypothetical protein